jgi:hypothetical protein
MDPLLTGDDDDNKKVPKAQNIGLLKDEAEATTD